jgi:hypothetical protein
MTSGKDAVKVEPEEILGARFGGAERGEAVSFKNCGATNRIAGFLSSDHPYKPNTACRWRIVGPRGARVWIKMLKMDIEEERPSDSSTCGSPFNPSHEACLPGQNDICEWDYLKIIAGGRESRKMCQFVSRFKKFAIQNAIPGTPDYSYFFDDYNYQSDPLFNNVVKNGWFNGKVFNTNDITVEFKSDAGANFYGFDLVWRFSKAPTTTTKKPTTTTTTTTTEKPTTTTTEKPTTTTEEKTTTTEKETTTTEKETTTTEKDTTTTEKDTTTTEKDTTTTEKDTTTSEAATSGSTSGSTAGRPGTDAVEKEQTSSASTTTEKETTTPEKTTTT